MTLPLGRVTIVKSGIKHHNSHNFFLNKYKIGNERTDVSSDVPPKMMVKGYMYPQMKKPVAMLI
jgi:hypothetical protein